MLKTTNNLVFPKHFWRFSKNANGSSKCVYNK